jgi:tetratricopeptide (TPR) repeat protein
VGKRVMPTKEVTISQAPGNRPRVVVATLTDMVYTVEAERGQQIQVRHRGVPGWFNKSEAVLLARAIPFFTARICRDPKDSEAYNHRAVARQWKGQYDAALKDCDEAIRLQPDSPELYNNRGTLQVERREYDKAQADLNQAIGLRPRYALAYYHRGAMWRVRREYALALKDMDQALELDPKLGTAYTGRGTLFADQKDYAKAIADYRRAVRIDPTDAYAHYHLGRAYFETKDYDKAIASYRAALRFEPEFAKAYTVLGMVYAKQKDYAKALGSYRQAIRLDPNEAHALNGLAEILATCPKKEYRNGKQAVEYARKACRLRRWKNPDHLQTMAAAYAELGHFTEAVRWQEKALEWADQLPEADAEDARQRLELYKGERPYRSK